MLKLKPRPSSAGDQEWRCYTEYWGDDELPTKTMHYSTHLDANVLVIFRDFHFVVSVVRKQPSEKNRLRVRYSLPETNKFPPQEMASKNFKASLTTILFAFKLCFFKVSLHGKDCTTFALFDPPGIQSMPSPVASSAYIPENEHVP